MELRRRMEEDDLVGEDAGWRRGRRRRRILDGEEEEEKKKRGWEIKWWNSRLRNTSSILELEILDTRDASLLNGFVS